VINTVVVCADWQCLYFLGNTAARKLEKKVDKILDAVSDVQTRFLSLELSHSLSHIEVMHVQKALGVAGFPFLPSFLPFILISV